MTSNLSHENYISKFMKGDVVVFMNHIKINSLQTIKAYQPNDLYLLENGQLAKENEIRSASLPELFHKRRLDEIEQSIAEVS